MLHSDSTDEKLLKTLCLSLKLCLTPLQNFHGKDIKVFNTLKYQVLKRSLMLPQVTLQTTLIHKGFSVITAQ